MSPLFRNKIFNEQGFREKKYRRIINGNTTNILELNEIKYDWAYKLYRTMQFTNFWVPQEISMQDDKKQYLQLTEGEKRAYELTLSFLIVLDSYQVNFLKEIARYITAPEIVLALTAQEAQEAIHAFAYQTILEAVVDPIKADEIYNMWREDALLKERIKVIAQVYDEFVTNPNQETFYKALVADYVLEGLYFYSGFAMFYAFAHNHKMLNTTQQIKYINRDELTHVSLFAKLILTLLKEEPNILTPELKKWTVEFIKQATDSEIKFGQYVTNNNITGLNNQLIKAYIEYIANKRLLTLGFQPMFETSENPLPWIEKISRLNDTKTDFFQRKVLNYANRIELRWE